MPERAFLKEQLATPDVPEHLQASIMTKIERLMIREIFIEMTIAFLATLSLTSYLIWSWQTIWSDLQASSFIPLARLAFSDPDILFSNLQETAWSIIETVPVELLLLSLGLALGTICTIRFSLRFREARRTLSLQAT